MPRVDSRLPTLQRALAVKQDSLNETARTVDLVFATEDPAPMWHWDIGDYDEILACNEQAADLGRIRKGGALLSEHERDRQIGVIEAASFVGNQGVATVRFSTSPLGEQEFQDVKAGIRRNFSVGYRVKELTAEKVSDDDGNVYRATSWEPLEISLVSVPADTNCQAIRSAKDNKAATQPVAIRIPSTLQLSETMKRSLPIFFKADNGDNATTGTPQAPLAQQIDPAEMKRQVEVETQKALKAITENRRELREIAVGFAETNLPVPESMLNEALDKGTSVDQFRSAVLEHHRAKLKDAKPTPSGSNDSGFQVVGERQEPLSLGQRFTRSDAFKSIQKARGQGARVASIQVDEFDNFRATFTTGSVTNYNGIVAIPNVVMVGLERPTVADLLTQGTTNLTSIPYMQETAFTNAADMVGESGLKPEATFALEQKSAPVKKIAVTIPVSDEAFEDIPTLQSYIDNRLRYSVEMKEEQQLLSGDGTGNNLLGLLNTPNILTQAKGSDNIADAIKRGITKIKVQGFATPTGVILHPNTKQTLDLLKDANGQYYGNGPFTGSYGTTFANVDRIWGLPSVETTSISEGTALVVTRNDAMIWRKKGIVVDSTNSHDDDFTHNLVRLRAEERLAFTVFKPKSFCTVTGL